MSDLVKKNKSFIDEFIAFVKGFGVIGLAIGVIIGGAAKTIVDSLINNIINPIIAKIGGVDSISDLEAWGIMYGAFIGDLINFIILLFVVYVAVKVIISRFLSDDEKEKLGM